MSLTIVIPFSSQSAAAAAELARRSLGEGREVLLAGPGGAEVEGARSVDVSGGRGLALRTALKDASAPLSLVLHPDLELRPADEDRVLAPLRSGTADAVFGAHPGPAGLSSGTVTRLARTVTGVPLAAPFSGIRAFRTETLRSLPLRADDDTIDPEILVKLAAQQFRITEVPVESHAPKETVATQLRQARTLVRYLGLQNDADNLHEGYNTLARMEQAPQYNAWLARKFRPYLGQRVLEVGAGIGTITSEIEQGRELLLALEVDPFYVERLKNMFRDRPHVRPILSGVERADWLRLREERLDSIVLSNVLEHIEDDAEAIRNFRLALRPGGTLVLFVPALQSLYGSLDEAVGHFRRYHPSRLKTLLAENGFELQTLEWMNLVGIPGWFLNSRLLRRRSMPPLQLQIFDAIAPLLAKVESRVRPPIGTSLFAVARAV